MPARTRPNRRNLWLILPILPLLLLAFVYNSDLEKVAQAEKNLQLARDYNSRKEPQQAIGLVDNVLSQQPSVLLMKSAFQSVIDQIKIEKANALLSGQSNETTLSRLINEIRTEPARAEAERIKAILNDEKELKNAETLAQSGRWYEAEVIYLKHLNDSKMALRHRLKFHEILMKQGRLHEARSVYARGVFALDHPQDALLELAIKDNEETLPEKWAGEIELLSGIYPDDPRLQLATAFLESWRGNENRSAGILDKILEKWPDDAPTRNAAMQSAMALNNPAKARQMLEPLKITEPEALALAAWFSRNSDSYKYEYQLLQNLLKLKPVDRKVISRLAELALLINQPAESHNYQNLKKTAEAKIVDYYRLCRNATPLSPAKAMELRNFASDLGLVFDAWVWGELAAGRKPAPANQPLFDQKPFPEWLPPEMISKIINQAGSVKPESMAIKKMPEIKFQDVAAQSGLGKFVHTVSQASGQMIPPLSFAGGMGIIDFDNDGLEDVFAVQSGEFPPSPARPNSGDRLFRNLGGGKFDDVTAKSGIDKLPRGFGHGVAVGDIDNDGFDDLFITRWRGYALWRNRGDGTFEDLTERYGLAGDRDWPTSSAFADLDNDGDLDLYVCHYMEWVEGKAYPCIDFSRPGTYDCRPRDFPAMKDHLFRNDGRTFTDVSESAGIFAADLDGRGLGVVAVDVNDDNMLDLFVANDTTANFLFINKGGMKFEEMAFASGVAANAQGGFQAGMGVAAADVNCDGLVDLAVTNFYNESTSIFQNLGGGFFADRTTSSGVAAASRNRLGFGIAFGDFDNNGSPDLITANGHVTDGRPTIPFRMPLQLFQNQSKLHRGTARKNESTVFMDVTKNAGEVFSTEWMARGLVLADFDQDGALDALVQSQGDPLLHLKNVTNTQNNWVSIQLQGRQSNRDGIGARLIWKSGDQPQVYFSTGGGSFQSATSRRIQIGADESGEKNEVEIRWPSGQVDRLQDVKLNAVYKVTEGSSRPEQIKPASQ